ncbi:hypothetical protein GCM10009087_40970 [Sphingomonas oligophenolica]
MKMRTLSGDRGHKPRACRGEGAGMTIARTVFAETKGATAITCDLSVASIVVDAVAAIQDPGSS